MDIRLWHPLYKDGLLGSASPVPSGPSAEAFFWQRAASSVPIPGVASLAALLHSSKSSGNNLQGRDGGDPPWLLQDGAKASLWAGLVLQLKVQALVSVCPLGKRLCQHCLCDLAITGHTLGRWKCNFRLSWSTFLIFSLSQLTAGASLKG